MSEEINTPVENKEEVSVEKTASSETPRNRKKTFRSRGDRGRKRRDDSRKEQKEFEEEVLNIARVTRVVKGGRRMRFLATVAIGDKKGRVGIGTGKSVEVSVAIRKAVQDAKKNLITVEIVDGTIPYQKEVKYKSARIRMMPAPKGTGVIAGGAFRKIVTLAGLTDIYAKSLGTNTSLVSAQASIKALSTFPKRKRQSESDS